MHVLIRLVVGAGGGFRQVFLLYLPLISPVYGTLCIANLPCMPLNLQSKLVFTFVVLAFVFTATAKVSGQTPNAVIGTVPSAQGGVVSICSGEVITFQSLSTQVGLLTTYQWNFGPDAMPTTATGAGPHVVQFNQVSSSVNVSLVVDNQNGLGSDAAVQLIDVTVQPQSNLQLANTASGFSTDAQDGVAVFKKCASSSDATFQLSAGGTPGWSHVFEWGDGSEASTESDLVSGIIGHTYPIGQFLLTHTLTTPNGCQAVREYIVFNGAAPVVTVEGQGVTTCLPFPYQIDLLSNEVPIDYVVNFSDGSPSDVFTTVADTSIAHAFTTSSCGVDYTYAPGFPPIQNAFSATIVAQNLCSVGGFPTIFTVGPITISTPADAAIEQTPPNPVCENATIELTDATTPGENISSTGCDSTYRRVWQIPAGVSLESGTLGSFNGAVGDSYDFEAWTNGTDAIELSFSGAGTFLVGMQVGSACGMDSVVHEVEVIPAASLDANLLGQTLCSGDSTESFTFTSSVEGYEVIWSVGGFDGVEPVLPLGGSGVSPVDVPVWVPENSGDEDGTFVVTATLACTNDDPLEHLITVGPEANVLPDPLSASVCSGTSPEIALESNIDGATFTWEVEVPEGVSGANGGAGALIDDALVNSNLSASSVEYTVTIGSVACPGEDVVVPVAVLPEFALPDYADLAGCPGTEFSVEPVEPVEGASWSWENDETDVGLAASGAGNVPSFVAGSNSTDSPIAGTVTVTGSVANCPEVEATFEVTVFELPTATLDVSPNGGLHCITGEATITGTPDPTACTFEWSGPGVTGATNGASVEVNAVGVYTAEVTETATGCSAPFTVEVLPPVPVNIEGAEVTPVTCPGAADGQVLVDASAGALTWEWTPPVSTSEVADDLASGSYNVLVINASFCEDEADFEVTEPDPLQVTLVDSIASECGEANGLLEVAATGGNGGYVFNWVGAPNGAVIDGIDAGQYTVVVEDEEGCSVETDWDLACIPLVEVVPYTFISPNGDQRNDRWLIDHILLYPESEVWVYNRWGNLVHHASPYLNDWDGTFTEGRSVGEPLPAATYYFVIDTKKKSQDPVKGFLEIQTSAQ